MPSCSDPWCDNCGRHTAWKRRAPTHPERHERATARTRKRLVAAFVGLGVAVSFAPSPFGPLWETISINGFSATIKLCDGAILLRSGRNLTHRPLPKRDMTRCAKILQDWAQQGRKWSETLYDLPVEDQRVLAEMKRKSMAPATTAAFKAIRAGAKVWAEVDGDHLTSLQFSCPMTVQQAEAIIEVARSLGVVPPKLQVAS